MVIVITGPTAVGKTKLSIALASSYHGEIINADSTQIFKHLNIATAKVTKEEMAKELDCIIASLQYPPNVFTVWCRENSIVFAAFLRNTPRAKDFFNYGVIYNTILDLDKKIKFSIQKALELADELVFDKWNPFQSPSKCRF